MDQESEIKERVASNILQLIKKLESWSNEGENLQNYHNGRFIEEIPIEMTFPFAALYYTVGLAKSVTFNDDFIELAVDPKHFGIMKDIKTPTIKQEMLDETDTKIDGKTLKPML